MVILRKVLVGPGHSPVLLLSPLGSRKIPATPKAPRTASKTIGPLQGSPQLRASPWYSKNGAKGASLRVCLVGANRARSLGLVGGLHAHGHPTSLVTAHQPLISQVRHYSFKTHQVRQCYLYEVAPWPACPAE